MLRIEKILNICTCKKDTTTVAVIQTKDQKHEVYKNNDCFYIAENELTRKCEVTSTSEQHQTTQTHRTLSTINQHTVDCQIEGKSIATVHLVTNSTDVFINNPRESFDIIDTGIY